LKEKLESHTFGFQKFNTRQLFRPFGHSSVVSQYVFAIVLHFVWRISAQAVVVAAAASIDAGAAAAGAGIPPAFSRT
jgi:hypothetical protein